MEENNLSENSLNEKLKEEKEMEDEKVEASNIKQKILNSLPRSYVVLSVSGPVDKISLGGQIGAENIFAVKVENEKNKIETLIFDEEGQQIATINEQNRVTLQQDFLEKFKEFTGEPGKQNPTQKDYYDFQKEYSLSQEEMDDLWGQIEEKEMSEGNKEKTRNAKFAECLGVSEDDMLSIVEIKEQDTKTVLVDKDKKYSQIFIVELKRDSAGRGEHDWVAIEAMADGTVQKIAGHEIVSEPMNDIAHELNITNSMENEQLEYGEVDSYADAEGDHRIQVGQYRYPLNDGTTVILEIDRARNSISHVYKQDEEGKLVPMCVEHNVDASLDISSEEQIVKSVLQGEEVVTGEKKPDDDQKTPGGDAWDRLQRTHH